MISALIIYTQFFSRIVIPKAVDLSYVRKGVPILTLFGLLLGLISSLFFVLTSLVLPDTIAWILTLFFDVLLTGGFHLDGLADTADGLFSSRSKERMLEIMKDSRIGSNGVLALIFYYGLMIAMGPYLPQPKWLIVASLSMIGKVDHSALQDALCKGIWWLWKLLFRNQDQFHPLSSDCPTGCSYCWFLAKRTSCL